MYVTIHFEGEGLRFTKDVVLDALPDVGDAVRIRPVGAGDDPVNGIVTGREFVEADIPYIPGTYFLDATPTMTCILDVRQA